MLIILEDGKKKEAKQKIFNKWDLDFVVIGKTTDTNKLVLKFNNKIQRYQSMLWHLKLLFTIENGLKKLPGKTIDLKKLKKVTLEDALIKVLHLQITQISHGLLISMIKW